MYSKRNGFSLLDLLVKIVFAIIFILILIWLFNKKVPNMKPFYSNVFRENIKYMQDAGEAYFTDDKMPKEGNDNSDIILNIFKNVINKHEVSLYIKGNIYETEVICIF